MPRRPKTYHYIYRTTCLVTGKFYVGMHSTDDLNDGYLGSGKVLRYSINKHGAENHRREIIEMCPSREALKLREKDLVNEELLADPLCINLKYGGEGGGYLWNDEHRKKFVTSSRTASLRGTEKAKQISLKSAETRRQRGTMVFPRFDWTGRKHTEQTIRKQSESMIGRHAGERNPSYGTCWVTNGKPIKIKKEQLDEYLLKGYRRGRI